MADTDTKPAQTENKNVEKLVNASANNAPPWLAKYLKMAAPAISKLAAGLQVALPHVINAYTKGKAFYDRLPADLLTAVVGFVFCFTGGMYPTLFAAIQAVRLTGWATTKAAVEDIAQEAALIIEENKKDDDKDDDNDGVKDVHQLDGQALLLRKTKLVLTKCDPGKINKAMAGLYLSWIAVVATLKIQFAKTITLALTIAAFLAKPADMFLKPTLDRVVPKEYQKWIPVCLAWLCKSLAMSVAWYIQRVQSAFSSAIQGGLMASRALLRYAVSEGITLGGYIPSNLDDTYLDEAIGWSLAALGFYFQYLLGFAAPFPINILLFPFGMGEWFIQWSITSA